MLEHVIKAQRGKQKYQLYSFFNLTPRWLWKEGNLVPIAQEARWAPGPFWMDAKKLKFPNHIFCMVLTLINKVVKFFTPFQVINTFPPSHFSNHLHQI